MEALLTRYRNLTVLLIAFFAQLVLIAFQVRTGRDVPLLRVWAITAVTPVEQALEFVRRNTIGVVEDYFVLVGVRAENERLKKQMGELKLQNHYLQSELSTADRVQALSAFQAQSPSKMLAARVIGNGTGANSQVVFIDRGSGSEVEAGMAVITPDGIVGKVIDSYPTAALVMLVTDPSFAAGVISQKNKTRGTLKGQGQPQPFVDYVQNEQKVDPGEMFFTSGDDRIFPKGFPVGKAEVVKNGKSYKQVYIAPSAFQGGLEEVLVVLEGVHQPIPELEIASPGIKMMPPPPDAAATAGQATAGTAALSTDADRLKAEYKQAGDDQKHVFGDGNLKPPDFSKLGQPVVVPPKPDTASKALPDGRGSSTGAAAIVTDKPKATAASAASASTAKVAPDDKASQVPAKASTGGGAVVVDKPKAIPAIATTTSTVTPDAKAPQMPAKPATGAGAVVVDKPKAIPVIAATTSTAKPATTVVTPDTKASQTPVKPLPDGRGSSTPAGKPATVTPEAKPKPRVPLLVTDPADANPELTAPLNTPKPKQQNQ
jgi:rod shape-determining protein MreC